MRKNRFFLILIVFLGFFLRFHRLGSNPPALSWDEAAWGYNAYSLGLTAKDEFGRLLPLDYLESFGDFKPPVYAYLTILPVKIFGLNEFATRFASAFFGALTVLATYFLVKEIFANSQLDNLKIRSLPLMAAFLLAISPWHMMLSRAAFEANVASFFIIAGVTMFLAGIRKNSWWLPTSAASFALSLHTFNTARVIAPLMVLILVVAFHRQLWLQKKQSLTAAGLGLLIVLPAIAFFLSPQAKLRFKEVNIFSNAAIVERANQEVANDKAWLATLGAEGGFTWWSRIIHNRRWGYAREYLRHYLDHFNPAFLFIKGDGNPKFSTQDVGELYLWELPFLVLGCLILFKRKWGLWWLIPFWLLVGIVPAATARETPHALRIETTLPTWQILTALGLVTFWQWLQKQRVWPKRILLITCCLSLVANFVYFQHGYWRHYLVEFAGEWEYGYRRAIDFVKEVEADYDEIWFTDKIGRPYIFFLFYFQKDPREFRQQAQIARDVFGFVEVESFGKYHFFREKISAQGRVLIFDDPGRVPTEAVVVKTICLPNGKETLKAYEI